MRTRPHVEVKGQLDGRSWLFPSTVWIWGLIISWSILALSALIHLAGPIFFRELFNGWMNEKIVRASMYLHSV